MERLFRKRAIVKDSYGDGYMGRDDVEDQRVYRKLQSAIHKAALVQGGAKMAKGKPINFVMFRSAYLKKHPMAQMQDIVDEYHKLKGSAIVGGVRKVRKTMRKRRAPAKLKKMKKLRL